MSDIKNLVTAEWKRISTAKEATARDHINYLIVKALLSKSNDKQSVLTGLILKSFSPTTNPNKISNGWTRWKGLELAIGYSGFNHRSIGNIPLKDICTPEEWLPLLNYINEEFIKKEKNTIYFFVDEKLSPEQKMVQVSHLAFKVGLQLTKSAKTNPDTTHFIILECGRNIMKSMLLDTYVPVSHEFSDPGLTSVCTGVMSNFSFNSKIFKDFKLVKFS